MIIRKAGSNAQSYTRHAVPLQVEKFGKPVIGSIPTIIRSYKSAVTKRINENRGCHRAGVWQRNYYEHVIRGEIELNRIREYIVNNPLSWELDIENPGNLSKDTRAYYSEIIKADMVDDTLKP